jgi:hypothetical protein
MSFHAQLLCDTVNNPDSDAARCRKLRTYR